MSEDLYTGQDYARSNPSWHEEDSGFKAENIAAIIRAHQVTCQRIVDVGCGTGGVLNALLEHDQFRGASAVGYDIAPCAIDLAKQRQRADLTFHCADFSQTDDRRWDLLLCIDVFEHVDDYIGFLRKLAGRSKYYVFHIPLDMSISSLLLGFHLQQRKNVGHLHYFDRATALATLRDSGFDVIDARYTRTAEENLQKHPEWRTNIAVCGHAARRLIRSIAGEDVSVRVLGGASLMVLAR